MDFSLDGYSPPLSIWLVMQEYIAKNEIFEVKRVLGEDLIDQSNELREQINTILEIYHEYRQSQSASIPIPTRLPEPPEMRSRLTKEIMFFVEGIREQAKSQGRDTSKILDFHNKEIIDYAYESCSSRPSTSSTSGPSTSRSSVLISPFSSSAGSSCKNLRDSCNSLDVGFMREKLNYLSFDDVKQILRQHLQDEIAQLVEDFNQIQIAFCQEDNERSHSRMSLLREPSLSDLKEERHKLERALLDTSQRSIRDVSDHAAVKCKSSLVPQGRPSLKPVKGRPNAPLKAQHLVSHDCEKPTQKSMTASSRNDPINQQQQRPNSAQKLRKMVQEARTEKHL